MTHDNETIRRGDAIREVMLNVAESRHVTLADKTVAAIRAIPAAPASVQIKQLVWERGIVDYAKPLPGMKYVACSTTPHGCWAWWLDSEFNSTRTVERDEHHAKAAAQADYAARILAALDVQPAPDVAQIEPN